MGIDLQPTADPLSLVVTTRGVTRARPASGGIDGAVWSAARHCQCPVNSPAAPSHFRHPCFPIRARRSSGS